jgi:hypothetical protein
VDKRVMATEESVRPADVYQEVWGRKRDERYRTDLVDNASTRSACSVSGTFILRSMRTVV